MEKGVRIMDNIIDIKKQLSGLSRVNPDNQQVIAIKSIASSLSLLIEELETREQDVITKESLVMIAKQVRRDQHKLAASQKKLYEMAASRLSNDMDEYEKQFNIALSNVCDSITKQDALIRGRLSDQDDLITQSIARMSGYRSNLARVLITVSGLSFLSGLFAALIFI